MDGMDSDGFMHMHRVWDFFLSHMVWFSVLYLCGIFLHFLAKYTWGLSGAICCIT